MCAVYLSVYLSICLSVCQSIYSYIYLLNLSLDMRCCKGKIFLERERTLPQTTQKQITKHRVGPVQARLGQQKKATPEDQLGWKICSASNDASATAESKPLGQELYLHGGREPKPTKKHKAHLQKRATKIITSDELAKCQGGQHIVQDVTQEKKSSCTNRLATHSSY